jgi:hypothetical protein
VLTIQQGFQKVAYNSTGISKGCLNYRDFTSAAERSTAAGPPPSVSVGVRGCGGGGCRLLGQRQRQLRSSDATSMSRSRHRSSGSRSVPPSPHPGGLYPMGSGQLNGGSMASLGCNGGFNGLRTTRAAVAPPAQQRRRVRRERANERRHRRLHRNVKFANKMPTSCEQVANRNG